MSLKIIDEQMEGLVLFEPKRFFDERGYFFESFREDFFSKMGLSFIQENQSLSQKNVIRGMHFQWDKPQGKLIRVICGSAVFYEIDIRKKSKTLGKYYSVNLNSDNQFMLWVPPGFANGFLALTDNTIVQYKCTQYWNPKAEGAIRWNDDEVNIQWGIEEPIVSAKDMNAVSLKEWLLTENSNIF